MILVTGSAGFIGAHVVHRLLARGERVVGLDDHNAYYDPDLKERRLRALTDLPGYTHVRGDIGERAVVEDVFDRFGPTRVVHLAAQAGVRYSLQAPHAYGHANLTGFLNVLDAARRQRVAHLVYASSSSVYGDMAGQPMAEDAACARPLSLYAATKRANELMAHSYAHLYGLPSTGLRLFTVYGPWGRPDMAPMLFARAILEDRPITLFNRGHHARSFTFIDDVARGVLTVLDRPPAAAPSGQAQAPGSGAEPPWRLLNIGNPTPTPLMDFVHCLERALGRRARIQLAPAAPGDVGETAADAGRFEALFGAQRFVPLQAGMGAFAHWMLAEAARSKRPSKTASAAPSFPGQRRAERQASD